MRPFLRATRLQRFAIALVAASLTFAPGAYAQAPAQAPSQTPAETPSQAPAQTPSQAPAQTPSQTSVQAPAARAAETAATPAAEAGKSRQPVVLDRIVAIVNEEAITQRELDERAALAMKQ